MRVDVGHPHVSVLVWENLAGEYGPPYVVFCGDSIACIPTAVLDMASKDLLWVDVSPSGFMTDETYERFRQKQIAWLRAKHGPFDPSNPETELIFIVDNHSSHLALNTVMLAAVHGIHDVVGPGDLTHCWQVHPCSSPSSPAFLLTWIFR